MHSLLKRQMNRYLKNAQNIPDEFQKFIQAVNKAYHDNDEERRMLERAFDLSSQELMEVNAELRESEEKYRMLFEYSPLGHLYFDERGCIVDCNDNCVRIVGSSREAIVGWNMLRLPDKKLASCVRKTLKGKIAVYEGLYTSMTAEKAESLRIIFAPVNLGGKNIRGGMAIVEDITERKREEAERQRLEIRLQRAEKMEVLGKLAGGVAHDLNNILGTLSGYSELLLQETYEGQRSRNYAEKILLSTDKGAMIVQDLLTLSRRSVASSEIINLNSVVTGFFNTPVFDNIKDSYPRVAFRFDCKEDVLNVKGSPVHLEKTLMNLVLNAAESIEGAGKVTIRTENCYIDKTISGYDEINEGDYTALIVSDTGAGIPDEHRENIFEPFYTSKTMGRSGTGLGLAIVWGTVKDYKGYIDVQSTVGKGTTFTLYFPATREDCQVLQKQKTPVELYMGKGESVLVVDDVAEQREVATMLLTRLGYEVKAVSRGEEAVAYLKKHKADILVLDMIMDQGIDGLETFQRILEINPYQKAILVSGFSQTDRVKEAQRLGAGAYVKKPYIMARIGVAIRDELDKADKAAVQIPGIRNFKKKKEISVSISGCCQ